MNLVSRVKSILFQPVTEWHVIDGEPDTPVDILKSYVAIVAAIPAVCGFIGASIIGMGFYRAPFFLGLIGAIVHYVLTLVGVFVMAFVIDALAPMFGGRKDFNRAFKVAAYAPTAAWVAGVFALIPAMAILMILGLYSLYLFFIGLPILMQSRTESSVAYVLVVLVAATVVWMLISFMPITLLGMRMTI